MLRGVSSIFMNFLDTRNRIEQVIKTIKNMYSRIVQEQNRIIFRMVYESDRKYFIVRVLYNEPVKVSREEPWFQTNYAEKQSFLTSDDNVCTVQCSKLQEATVDP